MKELTIEQRAKAYDEAIEKAKEYYKDCKQRGNLWFVEDMEDMFPELKESEDEKTKRLLHTIANKMSQHLRDIFTEEEFQCFDAWSNAWLEKQGEQKPAEWSEEDENLLKLSLENLTELKDRFGEEYGKVGDCIVWHESIKDRIQHQTSWKPSNEQIYTLEKATHIVGNKYKSCLASLYQELKKLMEE